MNTGLRSGGRWLDGRMEGWTGGWMDGLCATEILITTCLFFLLGLGNSGIVILL